MNERTLDAIGLHHGTDKSSRHHDYLNFYETAFAPKREEPLTILEIGVFNGASLRTWHDYFPNARIIGCDIDPMARRWGGERIEIEYMDQSNIEDLVRVGVKYGPFDIIIEDGSHIWDHQTISLKTLYPFVRPGGIYIAEDLQTNYGDYEVEYRGLARQSCVDFLMEWLDLHIADNALPLNKVEDPFLRTYGRAARSISFHKRVCLIEKRALPLPAAAAASKPLIIPTDGAEYVRLGLVAHVSHVGDVYGPEGYVDIGHDKYTFQGVAVDDPEQALEYRVRGQDYNWGAWLPSPDYAGTRGRAQILTGVSVRLRESAKSRFRLHFVARFAGSEVLIACADGEDCFSPNRTELRALQILLARTPGSHETT